ncbi:MAG: tetratricopeptide repeat protein [Bacteroidota bacterium]
MEQRTNKIISYSILSIWGLIIVFGIITVLSPDWLSNLSNPGKNVEAISMKNHGDNFLKSKKYNLAITQYTKALKIVPELKSAIANMAIAYQKTGDFNKAIITFKHLLTLNPEYPGVIYYNLGEIYEKIGDHEKSINFFLKASSTAAFPEKSYQKVGHNYMNQKKWDKAIDNFKLAIDNRKDIKNTYRGMLLTNQKAYADTSEMFIELGKIISAKNYLNHLWQYDDKIFNKQLSNDISLAKTYNNTGYCMALQENYNEAQYYLEIAIKINPSYTEAINNLIVVNGFINKKSSK